MTTENEQVITVDELPDVAEFQRLVTTATPFTQTVLATQPTRTRIKCETLEIDIDYRGQGTIKIDGKSIPVQALRFEFDLPNSVIPEVVIKTLAFCLQKERLNKPEAKP